MTYSLQTTKMAASVLVLLLTFTSFSASFCYKQVEIDIPELENVKVFTDSEIGKYDGSDVSMFSSQFNLVNCTEPHLPLLLTSPGRMKIIMPRLKGLKPVSDFTAALRCPLEPLEALVLHIFEWLM